MKRALALLAGVVLGAELGERATLRLPTKVLVRAVEAHPLWHLRKWCIRRLSRGGTLVVNAHFEDGHLQIDRSHSLVMDSLFANSGGINLSRLAVPT